MKTGVPFYVRFTVSAFNTSTHQKDITVNLSRTMNNTNYSWDIQIQSNIRYSTQEWLTAKVFTKYTNKVVVRIYNEQDIEIEASTWIVIIYR